MKKVIVHVLPILIIMQFFSGCISGSSEATISRKNIENRESITESQAEELKIFNRTGDEGKLVFYFFNVEELDEKWGDCTLVCLPEGEIMLIDTGAKKAAPYIVEDLMNLGVSRIDYLVLSHWHSDHEGGINLILDTFVVGKIFAPAIPCEPGRDREVLIERLNNEGYSITSLERDDRFKLGGVEFEVFNPSYDEENINHLKTLTSMENPGTMATIAVNNNSFVFKMIYGETSALFTGDIFVEAEIELISIYGDMLKADLLKVPHHGHTTSGSTAFLRVVKPKYSVSMGNILMDIALKQRYEKYSEYTYQTALCGFVKVIMNGKDIFIITEKTSETRSTNAIGE